jgi:hypothetical protein
MEIIIPREFLLSKIKHLTIIKFQTSLKQSIFDVQTILAELFFVMMMMKSFKKFTQFPIPESLLLIQVT